VVITSSDDNLNFPLNGGYVASTLELGIGFYQVFWNPNRMTLHDRIAELTIDIKTRVRNRLKI